MRCVLSLIFLSSTTWLVSSISHNEGVQGVRPSEWCHFAVERVDEIPVYMRSLMVFLCSRQAGEVKTFRDVSICMEAVKGVCYKQCENDREDQVYRSCIYEPSVLGAYRWAEEMFHDCLGPNYPCIRLRRTKSEAGSGCWQQCFQFYSDQCFSGCMPVSDESADALDYLNCALKMNPAHQAFRNCLLGRIPDEKLKFLRVF